MVLQHGADFQQTFRVELEVVQIVQLLAVRGNGGGHAGHARPSQRSRHGGKLFQATQEGRIVSAQADREPPRSPLEASRLQGIDVAAAAFIQQLRSERLHGLESMLGREFDRTSLISFDADTAWDESDREFPAGCPAARDRSGGSHRETGPNELAPERIHFAANVPDRTRGRGEVRESRHRSAAPPTPPREPASATNSLGGLETQFPQEGRGAVAGCCSVIEGRSGPSSVTAGAGCASVFLRGRIPSLQASGLRSPDEPRPTDVSSDS